MSRCLRLLDKVVGTILYNILPVFCKKTSRGKHILVIKLWALGESVLTLPAIAMLKRIYPKKRIIVFCTKNNKDIFIGQKFIDEVFVFDFKPRSILRFMNRKDIGISIDFEPFTNFSSVISYLSGAKMRIGFSNRKKLYTHAVEPQEDLHAVKNFVNLIRVIKNVPYPKKLVKLAFTKNDEQRIKEILKGLKSKMLIGIHAGSAGSSISRRWPEEKWAKLCDNLIQKYKAEIILVGQGSDSTINKKIVKIVKNKNHVLDLSGKIKLKELFAVMKKLDLFIGNDSGPMHIAAAMGVPTIGLFGPNLPERYGPYGKQCIGIYKGSGKPSVMPFRGIFSDNSEINKIKVRDVLKYVCFLIGKLSTKNKQ